jgi:enterochelin esterase-like enzyme
MKETHHRLRSSHLQNDRSIWIHEPERLAPVVTVFLDAEFYRERVGAVQIVEDLHGRHEISPSVFVFVSMESIASRWIECECHLPFARFIDEELFPWLEERYPILCSARECVIVGLSYTGLAAAYASMMAPHRFTKVIAQSGSFWWNDCWISSYFDGLKLKPKAQFYLDVGNRETAENIRHKGDVLQVVSQIEGVKRFYDILLRYDYRPKYIEFDGGHDFAAWRITLPDALRWALSINNKTEPNKAIER